MTADTKSVNSDNFDFLTPVNKVITKETNKNTSESWNFEDICLYFTKEKTNSSLSNST
jgi:hypothetical protein